MLAAYLKSNKGREGKKDLHCDLDASGTSWGGATRRHHTGDMLGIIIMTWVICLPRKEMINVSSSELVYATCKKKGDIRGKMPRGNLATELKVLKQTVGHGTHLL